MIEMKKDFKQFLILLIVSIFIAFTASFGYSVYQNYQREKKINEVKNLFNFGGTSEEKKEKAKEEIKTEEITKPEEVNSKESWNNLIINELQKDYVLDDTRPFYKKLYDKIRGKKIYNFKSINNENETLVVEMNDNKITEKFFNDGKEVLEKELVANDDFSSYDLKAHNIAEKYTATFKDMLGKDTYLNTKNGLIEYQDGRKIEFIHKNAIMNGEAQKFYANGDKEDFFYGNNEKKNGASIYFFANGEREEVAYKDGVLEGPAIYIFNDGIAEHYEYKNGKRVEE